MTQSIKQLHEKAQQALSAKQYQQAHGFIITLLQQDKYFADAYFLLGIIACDHHNHEKGIQLFEQALKLEEHNAGNSVSHKIEYLSQLAKTYALVSDPIKANHFAKLAAELVSSQANVSALTFDTLGVAFSKIGLHQKAIPLFQQAVKLNTSNAAYYFNLGVSQTFSGDFSGAKASHENVIKLDPSFSKSYTALSSLGGVNTKTYNLPNMLSLFESVEHPDEKLHIGHAIAREYEALKDYDQSFKYLSLAKQAKLNSISYNFADDKAMFESLFTAFTEDKTSVTPSTKSFDNNEAIFIVGMPRSGTTLVERILSQHTEVTTAGELEYFSLLVKKMSKTSSSRILDKETIEAAQGIDFEELGKAYIEQTRVLTGKTPKFIDKMPLNVLYVGFILQALPNAKIVCLDRSPLDTIMSNFRQLFSANSYNYNYAYSLPTTAQYFVLFKKLAEFWVNKFPDNFYQVNYQELVNEPELKAKELIKFCGLQWQASCLHINSNMAPVATASAVQVRQPINNKSIDNWKKYDVYLDEVKQILKSINLY